MLYKTCAFLSEGIEFRYNAIALCNRVGHKGGGDIVVEYYDDKDYKIFNFDINKYIEKRNEVILRNQTSELYPNCEGCIELNRQIYKDKNNLKLSNIVLHYWTKCNSHCIYCYTNQDKKYFNKRKNYKFLPILKQLIKDDLLARNGIVNWAGGEISCLDEFEKILAIFDEYNYFSIFNSSGIKFEKSIAKHLENNKGMLILSIDSGKKETHKKIKQVNSYEKVWKNIKKYEMYCKKKSNLLLKYIILPEINDSEEEITLFLEKIKETNCKYAIFDIDIYYLNQNRDNIPEYIVKLFHFALNKTKELDLNFILYNNAAIVFNQGKWQNSDILKYVF